MASYIYPIEEVHKTVTRPISIEIIRRMLEYTGLDPNKFRANMKGFAEAVPVPNSTIQEHDRNGTNRVKTDYVMDLEVQEEIISDGATPVRYKDNNPIFFDKDLRIKIVPVMPLVKTTVSVVYQTRDKVEALNWVRRIKARVYQTATTHYHRVDYHYPIPKAIAFYLMVIHQLREQTEPYNETFGEWCKRCFARTYTVISNLAGDGQQLAIKERQTNIHGWFDFEHEPEKPEKTDDNAGGWTVRFDYIFHYQRPDSLVFDYPLMIHNSLLPIEMIQTERPEHRDSHTEYQSAVDYAQDRIALTHLKHGAKVYPGIVEPNFDDWIPPDFPPYTTMFSRSLIQLDLDDKKWVSNLDELLSEYEFKDYFLDYFKDNPSDLLKLGENIFNVVLYRWTDKISSQDNLVIDENLKISTVKDMQPRDMWHLCLYILVDPLALSETGWYKASKYCNVLKDWLNWVAGENYANRITCNLDGTADRDAVRKLINDIKTNAGGNNGISNPDGSNKQGPYGDGKVIPGFPTNPKFKIAGGIIAKRRNTFGE